MRDPYVIAVPAGATEIDLRPVLEPIVLQLLTHILSRDPHPNERSGAVSTDAIREFIAKSAERLEVTRLAEASTREDFVRALKRLGWEQDSPGNDIRWHRFRSNWVTLAREESYRPMSLTTKLDVIQTIASGLFKKNLVEIAREVLASRSVLDAVAWAAEE